MKIEYFMFEVMAKKMHIPDLEKGERNPYTKGKEIGNPYMRDVKIEIEEEDVPDLLEFLEGKGYNTEKFTKTGE